MKEVMLGRKQGAVSPCAACKLLRRRCSQDCLFAPYFPADEPHKFANVHKVFGASNVNKLLQELPVQHRSDAVSSMVYEANARVRDPCTAASARSPRCSTRSTRCRRSSRWRRPRWSTCACGTPPTSPSSATTTTAHHQPGPPQPRPTTTRAPAGPPHRRPRSQVRR
ncbi:LOB domain-containing protein 4 [Iris pallida]|uniref:LOB domain-containing protein 4 n=1 Tax=Iris pallida TaxID=29817 RepID=A0AAX6FFI4_IRIPA|nr:LOB domain-containing protein 4 [Iris pallida]